jgi:hypothetical protein
MDTLYQVIIFTQIACAGAVIAGMLVAACKDSRIKPQQHTHEPKKKGGSDVRI